MDTFVVVIYLTFKLILRAYYYLLFARAIMSWLPMGENGITDFIYGVTEIIIKPVRNILDKYMGRSAFPIDMSFTVVFIIITILLYVL